MAPLLAGILAYEELPRAYASATLVVDDTATHAAFRRSTRGSSMRSQAARSWSPIAMECVSCSTQSQLERRGVAAALRLELAGDPAAGASWWIAIGRGCWSSTPTPGGPSSFGTC